MLVCCRMCCDIQTYQILLISKTRYQSIVSLLSLPSLFLVYTTSFSKSLKVFYSLIVIWSAILKGVINLHYIIFLLFQIFRSIVKCMPDDCVSMKLWVAYRSYFLYHRWYIYIYNFYFIYTINYKIFNFSSFPWISTERQAMTEVLIYKKLQKNVLGLFVYCSS